MDINQLVFLGSNRYGQSGTGQQHHNANFTEPKHYCFPTFIKQVSCGSHHSAIVTIDGLIYAMGSNIHGTLGNCTPNLNYSFVPALVQNLNDVSKVCSGAFHMAAICNGALYMWGKGTDGQLGNGYSRNSFKPCQIQAFGQDAQDVSCGSNHTLVLTDKKQVYAFGNGIFGQLGTGSNRNLSTPTKVKLEKVEAVSAGDNHSLFLAGGEVYAAGDNTCGQIGIGSQKKYILQPAKVPDLNDICTIQAAKFSAALSNEGKLYIWGGRPKILSPIALEQINGEKIDDIRAGNQTLYALTTSGRLYSWNIGVKTVEQIKITKIETQCKAILDFAIGENHSLLLGDIVDQIQYSEESPMFLKVMKPNGSSHQSSHQTSRNNTFERTHNDSSLREEQDNLRRESSQQIEIENIVRTPSSNICSVNRMVVDPNNCKNQSLHRFTLYDSNRADLESLQSKNPVGNQLVSKEVFGRVDYLLRLLDKSQSQGLKENRENRNQLPNRRSLKINRSNSNMVRSQISAATNSRDMIKQLAQKDMKIGQLQQKLSRKELELQTQSQIIRMLRRTVQTQK